jgi:hypothetical protein
MAVAWIATGNKHIAAGAAALAEERRRGVRCPTIGNWMIPREGLADLYGPVGSLYRSAALASGDHPITWAMNQACQFMLNKHATGRHGQSERKTIPHSVWRSAGIVDDRKLGMILSRTGSKDNPTWREIEVPAAAFKREFPPERGRPPIGLDAHKTKLRQVVSAMDKAIKTPPAERKSLEDIADATGASDGTVKRISRIMRRRAEQQGVEGAKQQRKGGRPPRRRDVH